jgi:hypothetical protein
MGSCIGLISPARPGHVAGDPVGMIASQVMTIDVQFGTKPMALGN